MVVAESEFVHGEGLKKLFVLEQNVGLLLDTLCLFFPSLALLDHQILESYNEVLNFIGPVHFVGLSYCDPHVETEFLFPSGNHFVFLWPDYGDKDELGEVHDGEVFAGEEEGVIIAVDWAEDDDTDGAVLVVTGLEFRGGLFDEVVIRLDGWQFLWQELELVGLL